MFVEKSGVDWNSVVGGMREDSLNVDEQEASLLIVCHHDKFV